MHVAIRFTREIQIPNFLLVSSKSKIEKLSWKFQVCGNEFLGLSLWAWEIEDIFLEWKRKWKLFISEYAYNYVRKKKNGRTGIEYFSLKP